MRGTLKLMILIAVLIAAGYALVYLWTGALPAYGLEVFATLALITLVSIVFLVIAKPPPSRD